MQGGAPPPCFPAHTSVNDVVIIVDTLICSVVIGDMCNSLIINDHQNCMPVGISPS